MGLDWKPSRDAKRHFTITSIINHLYLYKPNFLPTIACLPMTHKLLLIEYLQKSRCKIIHVRKIFSNGLNNYHVGILVWKILEWSKYLFFKSSFLSFNQLLISLTWLFFLNWDFDRYIINVTQFICQGKTVYIRLMNIMQRLP